MSFQGDVAGIGLAELLQSIARGRREGVLTLTGRNGVRSHLGLQSGVLYLLPAPEEDPIVWKERARQAWVRDPDFRVDMMRMSEIARAHRIEKLYTLLDCEGVHFRFDPGPLPDRPSDANAEMPGAKRMPAVHCDGVSVEFMLLEYARISDELQGHAHVYGFSDHVVPRPLDLASAPQDHQSFYRQCDGTSSVAEIADRLAWPLRQARLVVAGELTHGRLRLAAARELLVLAQKELAQGHLSRAASRLSAWVQMSPPGPASDGDAGLLQAEWKAERMSALINLMPTREARILLRRIDHALDDPESARKHWRELARLHRHCPIAEIHRIAAEHRCEDEDDTPAVRELLDLARGMREARHPRRAGALLRIAADYVPATTSSQLELGMGMIAAGMGDEAAAWVLGAAATLVEEGAYDKAVPPLRALLEAAPRNREARALLTRARNLAVRRQIVRKHSVVGLAILLAMSIGAYVQIRFDRDTDRKLTEVANLVGQPIQARQLLDEYFPDDESPRVIALREAIDERQRTEENALRSHWYDRYKEAQLECSLGDPLLGLRRAMDIQSPPRLETIDEPWPLISDLFNGLAARMENTLAGLGDPQIDEPEQVGVEQGLSDAIQKLQRELETNESRHSTEDFEQRLSSLARELEQRANARATMIAERDRLDKLNTQDMMLAAARAHAQAGDSARALDVYQRLVATDATGKLARLLEEEIGDVAARHDVVSRAYDLAEDGRHADALALLDSSLEAPRSVALPWRLVTHPPGAEVRFPDGSLRHAPFLQETRAGQQLQLVISAPGCESVTLDVDGPADRTVWLSRRPDREWRAKGRVEALPVAAGRDHVVADRTGRVARIDEAGQVTWERELGTLGGVARAPVFLPKKPGHMLLLTEDGEAWILTASTGAVEGPYALGSPPVEGPASTPEGVVAHLADGRYVRWDTRLAPALETMQPDETLRRAVEADALRGSLAGLEVLRRGAGGAEALDSPWTSARVEATEDAFRIVDRDSGEELFFVRREGDWTYLAWEAPHTLLPNGRLWISDAAGLRAFLR